TWSSGPRSTPKATRDRPPTHALAMRRPTGISSYRASKRRPGELARLYANGSRSRAQNLTARRALCSRERWGAQMKSGVTDGEVASLADLVMVLSSVNACQGLASLTYEIEQG